MSDEITSLADRQLFWKTLFEEKDLAPQIAKLATAKHVDSITYHDVPKYGKVHVKVALGPDLGNHFQSDTFIVTARLLQRDGDDTPKTLSTFIKTLPSITGLQETVRESGLHQREINMYRHFFDYLREMRANHLIPLDVPDVYYIHFEEPAEEPADKNGSGTCILLEDLKAEGYRMVNKVEGLDYEHCKMALTSLAHYHALTMSAVRKWKDPTTGELSRIPSTVEFLLNDTTKSDLNFLQLLSAFSSELIVTFLKDIEKEKPYLLEWVTQFIPRMSDVNLVETLESSGPLVCIVHGDYWNNNILFKYEDGIPVSLRMLDFQMSRIGHPLGDVVYFLYTSTLPETRQKHMQDLLEYYFDTLTTDLRLLGISLDNYSMENIWADYKKSSLKWMFRGIMVLSMTQNKQIVAYLKKSDHSDAKKTLKEPTPGDEVVEGNDFQEMMEKVDLSDNSTLSDRILKLIEEVYRLNNSQTQI